MKKVNILEDIIRMENIEFNLVALEFIGGEDQIVEEQYLLFILLIRFVKIR